MTFVETALAGAFVIEGEAREDARGVFARTFCADEFRAHGLEPCIVQCNISSNHRKGMLRGLHYQAAPHQEAKVVRCVRGALFDVLVDLRRESPTYGRWTAVDLSAGNRRSVYVPKGVAHGFQTLADDTDVLYLMSERYVPTAARGVRWNDPAFAIEWPIAAPLMSARDAAFPDFLEGPAASVAPDLVVR